MGVASSLLRTLTCDKCRNQALQVQVLEGSLCHDWDGNIPSLWGVTLCSVFSILQSSIGNIGQGGAFLLFDWGGWNNFNC